MASNAKLMKRLVIEAQEAGEVTPELWRLARLVCSGSLSARKVPVADPDEVLSRFDVLLVRYLWRLDAGKSPQAYILKMLRRAEHEEWRAYSRASRNSAACVAHVRGLVRSSGGQTLAECEDDDD